LHYPIAGAAFAIKTWRYEGAVLKNRMTQIKNRLSQLERRFSEAEDQQVAVVQAVVQVKEDVASLTKELPPEPSDLNNPVEEEQPAVNTEKGDLEFKSTRRTHRSAGSTGKRVIWWTSGIALSTTAAIMGREWHFFSRATVDAGLCSFSFVSLALLLATHSAVIEEVGMVKELEGRLPGLECTVGQAEEKSQNFKHVVSVSQQALAGLKTRVSRLLHRE
jgi:uncharacterized coiled-coil protein SlyX